MTRDQLVRVMSDIDSESILFSSVYAEFFGVDKGTVLGVCRKLKKHNLARVTWVTKDLDNTLPCGSGYVLTALGTLKKRLLLEIEPYSDAELEFLEMWEYL